MADIFPFFSCVIFKFPRYMHHVCVENFLNLGFLTFLLQHLVLSPKDRALGYTVTAYLGQASTPASEHNRVAPDGA